MHFTSTIPLVLSIAVAGVAATPFKFPLPDGFPSPNPAQLAMIEKKAGGTLPDGPLPTILKGAGITTLQLLALNEIFEVAYFTELLANVTNSVPGYDAASIAPLDKTYVMDTLTAVVNQEQLHAAGVNGILMNANQTAIKPCQYQFPVTTFAQAVLLAQTFTDIVLGTLPEAQAIFAADAGDESPLVPLFGSVLAQEGEQVGFYRFAQKKVPSAAPFLTGGSPSFAFTAIQMFIVPGSCPQPLSNVNLTTFGPLTVVTTPEPKNMTLEFAVPGAVSSYNNSIAYLSGANLPVTVPISNMSYVAGISHFSASFPFASGFANGLTIAALVKGAGMTFASNDAVAAATLYGPGLIEVN
ncbi:hypothetical protein HO133_010496 [Letharia lupina]|uniref:Sexual development protein n=1 Tax=Letharia lupina TaxID=560253 RepID=A0A8H6CI58_9LECA|nr:uncharacterized protein HO133_010496 [Letharia lupina]KAF6223922.1 hypothetical protein HO133_010496 [Letharia lupina]